MRPWDRGAEAEGGKGPNRRWGRDQAQGRGRELRPARDTLPRSPGGEALAPAVLEAAAAGERLAARARLH